MLLYMSFSFYFNSELVCMHAESLQLCPTLCHPMDYSLQGSSVHGILQARILEWVAMPFSREFSWTQGLNLCLLMSPAVADGSFTTGATWEAPNTP